MDANAKTEQIIWNMFLKAIPVKLTCNWLTGLTACVIWRAAAVS